MKLVAINDRNYSSEVLREEIRGAKSGGRLELLVANGKSFTTYKVNYHQGERYPVLQRNGQPALMDDVLKPLTR
jgi:hypothetical protein